MADISEPLLAHHLVQILEMFIPVDAERAFLRMDKIVQAAKIWGYHEESAAVEVVVRTIRIYIADHRSLFQRNFVRTVSGFPSSLWCKSGVISRKF